MKYLLQLAVLGAIALPNLALADEMDPMKMTCAEFGAMDMEGMMAATDAMHMAGPDAAMAMDEAGAEMAMKHTMEMCAGKPDTMAMDAMMMQ